MERTKEQLACIETEINTVNLIEGYSGTGKSTVLLDKYYELIQEKDPKTCYIFVKQGYQKILLHQLSQELYPSSPRPSILTFEELIDYYIGHFSVPLFKNRISDERKTAIINELFDDEESLTFDLTFESIMSEIEYIQQNICIDEQASLYDILNQEFKLYFATTRKYSVKGLLTQRQKNFIWNIYRQYLQKSLELDVFDDLTLYQSVLRLLYKQATVNQIPRIGQYILIDDVQDFSKVELDVIDKLTDQTQEFLVMMSLDPLKSFDRYHHYKDARLFQLTLNHSNTLTSNFRNSVNVHRLVLSSLKGNELIDLKIPYNSGHKGSGEEKKSILTFFYNQLKDEKIDVIFDRLDLLTNILNYTFEDILFIFYEEESKEQLARIFEEEEIPFVSVEEKLLFKQPGISYMIKEEIIPIPYKVVFLYDADNKKVGTGAINKVINLNQNYRDSILFYQSLVNATDFLIIQTSVSELSNFLLPAAIDYSAFTFEISSLFSVKPQLNVLRLSDFVTWITDQLKVNYGYAQEDFKSHPVFDLIINNYRERYALKIHDAATDQDTISQFIKLGLQFDYLILFDNYHYIVYKKEQRNFVRVKDIPEKIGRMMLDLNV